MDKKKELPQRKHSRLKQYDYSSNGAYFVTICVKNRRRVLSRIVGRGLAPAETTVEYTMFGKIAEEQLLLLENRYSCLLVDRYVIMPNHIHVIFIFEKEAEEIKQSPTLMDIVCAFKSLTTRKCKSMGLGYNLFQTSFYEHIIRDRDDYEAKVKYICENPARWDCDTLYAEG